MRHLADVRRLGLVSGGGPVPRFDPRTFLDPPRGGVRFKLARVAANKALSPAELEERLALYAGRAERGEQLVTGVPCPDPGESRCWGCGIRTPRATHLAAVGWHVRRVTYSTDREWEMYCSGCFLTWGWPT